MTRATLLYASLALAVIFCTLILALVKIGVLEHRILAKNRKYIFVVNLAVCSFITPDPITTIFMVVPMTLLLEGCLLISAYWDRAKENG